MIETLFPHFSAAEIARRNSAVRSAMDDANLDAILIYGGPGSPEISYLANYLPASPCWLVWPRDGEPMLLVHFYNHVPCTQAMSTVGDVRGYGPSPAATLDAELRARNLSKAKVRIVSLHTVPYNQFSDLQTRLPDATFSEFGRAYNAIRWVRSDEESAFLRGGRRTDLACEALERE